MKTEETENKLKTGKSCSAMLALSRYHSGTEKLRNTSTSINPANLIPGLLRVEIFKIHEYELKEMHPENLQGKKKMAKKTGQYTDFSLMR